MKKSWDQDLFTHAKEYDAPKEKKKSPPLAFLDDEFLLSEELRPVRLQIELLRPELIQKKFGIEQTIVIFGSNFIHDEKSLTEKVQSIENEIQKSPNDPKLQQMLRRLLRLQNKTKYYEIAKTFAQIVSKIAQEHKIPPFFIATGGGGGIMEAANRGAFETNGKSIAMAIRLPFESRPNPYATPELTFEFHYFAIRKMHLLLRSRALVIFPGGFGTFDELFEILTLLQTEKMALIPVILVGRDYWKKVINFEMLIEEGFIEENDLQLFTFAETAEEIWIAIEKFYNFSL